MVAEPSFEDVEVIYVIPSTPFICSSSGVTTELSTVSALAPWYVVLTITVGGATSGYCNIGSALSPNIPSITNIMDITVDRTGLVIKVFKFISLF
jgi:hypothetical protein